MSLHPATLRYMRSGSRSSGEQFVRACIDDGDWCIRESWRERLLGAGSPDWFQLDGEARAELAKPGHFRAVWRVTLAGGTVYAKVAEAGRFFDRTKWVLLGSPAEREWRATQKAEARGVPVARSLGVGVAEGGQPRSVLLSEEINKALLLPVMWKQAVAGKSRRRRRAAASPLIDAVARLYGAAHDRGFVHRDGHPNNILVRHEPNAAPVGVFLDLHACHLTRRPVARNRIILSLAQLDQHFHRQATRTERLRFLRSYLEQRRSTLWDRLPSRSFDRLENRSHRHGVQCLRELLTAVALAREAHAHRLARQRDRRLRRDGKYFATLPLSGGWRAKVVLRLERRHLFPEADVPDRSNSQWQTLLDRAVTAVGDGGSVMDALNGSDLRAELSRPHGTLERFSFALRGSPHRRAFEESHRKRHRDQPGELILAYAEHRRAGLLDATLLVRPDRRAERTKGTLETQSVKERV